MSNWGIGVIINSLGGNADSVDAFTTAIGKVIAKLALEDDAIRFEFTDGYAMHIYDDGQSCCESRYMRTDDNLSDFIGATLVGAENRAAPNVTCEYGDEHEVEFLVIQTVRGNFTMSSHNEHNVYYGGFYVKAAKGWS
jgi:hypothetical protein